jgi:hypothetical protein
MALDIDGFAVLRSIGSHRNMFPDIAPDTAKAARSLIIKQINTKGMTLKSLRAFARRSAPIHST